MVWWTTKKKSSWFFFCLESLASKRAVRSMGCKGHALKGEQRQQNPDMNHEPLNHEIWSNYSDRKHEFWAPKLVVLPSKGNGTPYFNWKLGWWNIIPFGQMKYWLVPWKSSRPFSKTIPTWKTVGIAMPNGLFWGKKHFGRNQEVA